MHSTLDKLGRKVGMFCGSILRYGLVRQIREPSYESRCLYVKSDLEKTFELLVVAVMAASAEDLYKLVERYS